MLGGYSTFAAACAVLNERIVGPDTMISTARNDPNYYRLPGDGSHKWEERMSVREALVRGIGCAPATSATAVARFP